ncbi:MAG: molybdate ABC transporter substrate-binding protein [Thiotrichales bacterium]
MKSLLWRLTAVLLLGLASVAARAETLKIAAASDLKFAMAELVEQFRAERPDARVDVIYGSSGKFATQISNGAPYDLFFSADIDYPRQLERDGYTTGPPRPFALGRIVLWSLKPALANTPLADLPRTDLRRLAIANPQHAPYGRRAEEALRHHGAWEALASRLALGENIAHAAQFVDSGAADAGIVALALVLAPTLQGKGAWTLIPAEWHSPLEQGFAITRRAADKPLAHAFADFIGRDAARAVLRRYGFELPATEGR